MNMLKAFSTATLIAIAFNSCSNNNTTTDYLV